MATGVDVESSFVAIEGNGSLIPVVSEILSQASNLDVGENSKSKCKVSKAQRTLNASYRVNSKNDFPETSD